MRALNHSAGEILRGENIENSNYKLNMRQPKSCEVLCKKKYSKEELQQFGQKVTDEYRVHWIVDNLPAATRVIADYEGDQEYSYQRGCVPHPLLVVTLPPVASCSIV